MPFLSRTLLLLAIPCITAGSCGGSDTKDTEHKAILADGNYRVTGGQGYAPADEAKLLAITATLTRASSQLVFTLQDGSTRTLTFTPRAESAWQGDCYTTDSHALDELADLAPVPLPLESMTFNTPLVYAKCGNNRMVLTNAFGNDSFILVLDHQ